MGRPRITGPDTIDLWYAEPAIQHRGLLLFAMQEEGRVRHGTNGRSIEAVARAVGRSAGTVRYWYRVKRWSDRISTHGADLADDAVRLYRRMYLKKHGSKELPIVQHLIGLPIDQVAAPDPTVSEVQEEALRLVRKLVPPRPDPEIEGQVKTAMNARKAAFIRRNRKLADLTSKALEYIAGEIDEKRIRATLSDIPRLYDVVAKLEEERLKLEHPEAMGGGRVQDSARVQIAKASGTSVLFAVYEDTCEIKLLLEGMKVHRGSAAEDDGATIIEVEPEQSQDAEASL